MRTLVDIPESDIVALDEIRRERHVSRSQVILEAIAKYLGRHLQRDPDLGFGLWGQGGVDGVDYQRQLRSEW
jgi:hypothetical protein